jgi:uncharacterized Zn finger protein (UPF0148 family)
MKVCNRCGEEIFTRDGENTCLRCERDPVRKVKRARQARDQVLRDLGLVKVRGALGGTY